MSRPTAERLALAAELEAKRKEAGLSQMRLAAKLGWSQSKVSRILRGRTSPTPTDVEELRLVLAGMLDKFPVEVAFLPRDRWVVVEEIDGWRIYSDQHDMRL